MSLSFGTSAARAGLMLAGFTTVFMLANPMPALWSRGADRRAADTEHANSWTSFVLAIGYGLGALGPLTLGLVSDSTHSFLPALWILVAVGVLKLLLAPLLYAEHG